MATRAQFIAGVVDQQTGKGDHVGAMLIGLDALPDATSKGVRQRVLRPEISAVTALDGGLRNWSSGWGERTILEGHTGIVRAVAFSLDGTRVLTGGSDNTARLWPVFKSPQALINNVRSAVPRCLTPLQREAFHLGTPPPRWCYERNLWPFSDHGQPYIDGGSPPYGPPAPTWDERLLAAWDQIGSWFSRSSTHPP
jgi:WD40 repeat protein